MNFVRLISTESLLKISTYALLLCTHLFLFAHEGVDNFPVIYDLSRVEQEALASGADTLVVFDVDGVLIASDEFERGCDQERLAIREQVFAGLGEAIEERLDSIMWNTDKRVLMDQQIPAMIKRLQQKNVPVIALTAARGGAWGIMSSAAQWRFNDLLEHGIDLQTPFGSGPIMFDTLTKEQKTPRFENGILFTERIGPMPKSHPICSKGQVLAEFLKTIHWLPKKVIFVDDYINHLKSVEQSMNEMNIPCSCYHDRAIDKLPEKFDANIVKLQLNYLVKYEVWLSAEEAQIKMAIQTV